MLLKMLEIKTTKNRLLFSNPSYLKKMMLKRTLMNQKFQRFLHVKKVFSSVSNAKVFKIHQILILSMSQPKEKLAKTRAMISKALKRINQILSRKSSTWVECKKEHQIREN